MRLVFLPVVNYLNNKPGIVAFINQTSKASDNNEPRIPMIIADILGYYRLCLQPRIHLTFRVKSYQFQLTGPEKLQKVITVKDPNTSKRNSEFSQGDIRIQFPKAR